MKGDENMKRIIFASHGEFSSGLKNSISMIVGDLANTIETYSLYPGEIANDYRDYLKEEIQKNSKDVYHIFCDIKGGSVHTALSQLCVFENVFVYSGTNMNLVLDTLLSDDMPSDMIHNARNGITMMTKKDLASSQDEEF